MIRQHPPAELIPDNPLWAMATNLWRDSSFANACLAAQTEGCVVSHILVALGSAEKGLRWNGTEPDSIGQWRRQATEPLRALRSDLVKGNGATDVLRETLKKAELEAERVELAWWHQAMCENRPEPVWQNAPGLAVMELAADNLAAMPVALNNEQQEQLITVWQAITGPQTQGCHP